MAIARACCTIRNCCWPTSRSRGWNAPAAALLEKTLAGLHAAGKTIVLANHDLRQSLALCQRVVVLAGGRKVLDAAAGTVDAEGVLECMQGGGPGDKVTGGQGDKVTETAAGGVG